MNLHCPSSFNPADFYIKCLTQGDAFQMSQIFRTQKNVFPNQTCWDHLDNLFSKK